jgi:hypothetical protein
MRRRARDMVVCIVLGALATTLVWAAAHVAAHRLAPRHPPYEAAL